MSVFFTLVNDRDRTLLTLGTGRWAYVFDYEAEPAAVEIIETRLVLHFAQPVERLAVWAKQIAAFMNGASCRLTHDHYDEDVGIDGYRDAGALAGRGFLPEAPTG